jgi:hypothetical protein
MFLLRMIYILGRKHGYSVDADQEFYALGKRQCSYAVGCASYEHCNFHVTII